MHSLVFLKLSFKGSNRQSSDRMTTTALRNARGLNFNSLFGPSGEDYVWNMIRADAQVSAASEPLLAR